MESRFWKRGSFTVPSTVSDERVQLVADRYIRRFGEALEAEGFKVLLMKEPVEDTGIAAYAFLDGAYDRKQYVMWALVSKRPFEMTVDVPDKEVHMMEQYGFRLKG